MPLKQRQQIFQINVNIVKNPNWQEGDHLVTKRDRGFELGTTEKQIPLVSGWRP